MSDLIESLNHRKGCGVYRKGVCTCPYHIRSLRLSEDLTRFQMDVDCENALRERDEARRERDELQARLHEIQGAEDICSKVGRPCRKCMESFAEKIHHEQVQRAEAVSAALDERNVARSERDEALAQLAKVRQALSDLYSECKCEHEAIDAVNMKAYRALHGGSKP